MILKQCQAKGIKWFKDWCEQQNPNSGMYTSFKSSSVVLRFHVNHAWNKRKEERDMKDWVLCLNLLSVLQYLSKMEKFYFAAYTMGTRQWETGQC